MIFEKLRLPDLIRIVPDIHWDERGFFKEIWNRWRFAEVGLDVEFRQDNLSRSRQGTLRGLHYQLHNPQGKLVWICAGEVVDVAVDLRRSSATFGKWLAVRLSADGHEMLWIPPGFAHGFYVVSEAAELNYKCTDLYAPAHERTILWNDPDLAIDWQLPPGAQPLISAKDAHGTRFREAEVYP